jgi:hypothetical protein
MGIERLKALLQTVRSDAFRHSRLMGIERLKALLQTALLQTTLFMLLSAVSAVAQNYWTPDSTAYRYLSRGDNPQQWQASPGTRVETDTSSFLTPGGAIKWTIPPNTSAATLELMLVDVDLRERVLYTTCKRNNYAAPMTVTLHTGSERGYRLHEPVYVDQTGKHLPAELWQQRGTTITLTPFGGAKPSELAHARSLRFRANEAEVEQILWIDEIKHIAPRGPAAIIHFNHYRGSADSLLTPWLLANGYRANLDFTFELAEREAREMRGESGIWTRYVGLGRIAELARNHHWSTTHHGTFYKALPLLPTEQRMRLYALAPFEQAGFAAQWCFSIPSDAISPTLYAELMGLQRFFTIRRQGERRPNELPIDEPQQLRFFRPTSAAAGPNVTGKPRTLAQMQAEVDEAWNMKGLLIFDFGAIVTAPSPSYTGSEVTLLEDAQNLIRYAEARGFTFLTFEDLFAPDPNYRQALSLNHDYADFKPGLVLIPVLQNDLCPRGDSLRVLAVGPARHGEVTITENGQSVKYAMATGPGRAAEAAQEDCFYYVARAGNLADTAWVFISAHRFTKVEEHRPPANYALAQSYPNPFRAATRITFALARPAEVELEVYSLSGQRVATLIKEKRLAGQYQAWFRAARMPTGIYFYQLKLDGRVVARNKLVRLRS